MSRLMNKATKNPELKAGLIEAAAVAAAALLIFFLPHLSNLL
jgi:hypothetical protein